jgi:hypothetical protein
MYNFEKKLEHDETLKCHIPFRDSQFVTCRQTIYNFKDKFLQLFVANAPQADTLS